MMPQCARYRKNELQTWIKTMKPPTISFNYAVRHISFFLEVLGEESNNKKRRLTHQLTFGFLIMLIAFDYFLMGCYFIIYPGIAIFSILVAITLRSTIFFSVRQSCNQIHEILDRVSAAMKKLEIPHLRMIKIQRKSLRLLSVVLVCDIVITCVYSSQKENREQGKSVSALFYDQGDFLYIAFSILDFLYLLHSTWVLHHFCLYYSSVCEALTCCWEVLETAARCQRVDDKWLCWMHHELYRIMQTFDNVHCFQVFIAITTSMVDSFWSGYTFVFCKPLSHPTRALHCGLLLFSSLFVTFWTLVKGSEAVRAASLVRETARVFRKKELQRNDLTLWKFYSLKKSLVISVVANLFTYGILVGTLGSVQK